MGGADGCFPRGNTRATEGEVPALETFTSLVVALVLSITPQLMYPYSLFIFFHCDDTRVT